MNEQQQQMIVTALVDCAVEAAILRPVTPLTGPELLGIAADLKEYIKVQRNRFASILYCINGTPRLFRWNDGKLQWATPMPHSYGEPEWNTLEVVDEGVPYMPPFHNHDIVQGNPDNSDCVRCQAGLGDGEVYWREVS
jgi:hypothetical protein